MVVETPLTHHTEYSHLELLTCTARVKFSVVIKNNFIREQVIELCSTNNVFKAMY
jgi:hypothetical protein